MKIGEIIEIEGEKYITQKEILACRHCHFCNLTEIDCYKEYGCRAQDGIIFVKIPIELLEKIEQMEKQIEMMKNCYNCNFYNEYDCSDCKNYDKWEAKE